MGYYINEIITLLNSSRKLVADITFKELIKEAYSFEDSQSTEKTEYCSSIVDIHNYLHEYITFNEVIYENDIRHVITILENLINRYQLDYSLPVISTRQLIVEPDLVELYPSIFPGSIIEEVFKTPSTKLKPYPFVNLFNYSEGIPTFNIKFSVDNGYYLVDNIKPNKKFLGNISNYEIHSENLDIVTVCDSNEITLDNVEINATSFDISTSFTINDGDYPVTNLSEPSKFYINSEGIKTPFIFPANQQKQIITNTYIVELTEAILANTASLMYFNILPSVSTRLGESIEFTLAAEDITNEKRQQIAIPEILYTKPHTLHLFSTLTNSFINATSLFTNLGSSVINNKTYYVFEYNQAKHGSTLIKIQF